MPVDLVAEDEVERLRVLPPRVRRVGLHGRDDCQPERGRCEEPGCVGHGNLLVDRMCGSWWIQARTASCKGLEAFITACDICFMTRWLALTATLPTAPSGLRVRVWRALKATGAGTLREGVHLLPEHAPTAQVLRDLERTIAEAGAQAHLLVLTARDEAQEATFRALFDRSELYAGLLQSVKQARGSMRGATEAQLHKILRGLERQLHAVQTTDFFPGRDGKQAAAAVAALRRAVELQRSPGEPAASATPIEPRALADHQGRTWATRKRPWVDRLATAWLVQRFIDHSPTFVWLADPKKCPAHALGYDFDGATFTHVRDKVSFEVVAESFGLLGDAALRRLAALVRYIDVGGIPVDEAPGIETLVRGLQARHADDDELLAAALPLFDAYHAALQVPDDH
jgi:hypothetical protein